jgi:hypothetical protein
LDPITGRLGAAAKNFSAKREKQRDWICWGKLKRGMGGYKGSSTIGQQRRIYGKPPQGKSGEVEKKGHSMK